MSSARASGFSLASRNLCNTYNTLLSPANYYGVPASQLPVNQNGRAPTIQQLVAQNCGVPTIQLLVTLNKRKEKKTPSPLVRTKMLARKNDEEKGGILKYLPPLYLPLLPFTLTETVPQPFSVGHPMVFLPAVEKSVVTAVTNTFLPLFVGLNENNRYLAWTNGSDYNLTVPP